MPEAELSWSDTDVPLQKRGVSGSWLIDFVHEVDRQWQAVVEQHERDKLASIRYDTPWPDPLPFGSNVQMTPVFVVNNVIRPLTHTLAAPLFARVPERFKGVPDIFVSHAWSDPLTGNGAFSTLYALDSPLKSWGARNLVWIDLACYNQHRTECIADDMKAVIAAIGRVGFPWIKSTPVTRLWCLWELLCAHVGDASIELYEANGSAYDLGWLADNFKDEFKSVEHAETTVPEDREQILGAIIATFGSLAKADEYVRQLVNSKLSAQSDKPWNKNERQAD